MDGALDIFRTRTCKDKENEKKSTRISSQKQITNKWIGGVARTTTITHQRIRKLIK